MISLIIGLGNIGSKYTPTRHNLGFELLNRLATRFGVASREYFDNYHEAAVDSDGRTIRLLWPTTYVNKSGLAAADSLATNGLSPADIIVVYDDFELPLGRLRIRTTGSAGGHRGMASIIDHLGTDEILRLRMGIGPIPPGLDPVAFVLGKFAEEEIKIKNKVLEKSVEAVLYLLVHPPERAMDIYNRDPAPDEQHPGPFDN